VATIAFKRPKALNALSTALLDEMSEALKDAEKNDHVNVIVLTGTGKKAFCAGAEITEVEDLSPVEAMNYSMKVHLLFRTAISPVIHETARSVVCVLRPVISAISAQPA
jgi:enoyl-CoA hydratase